MTTMIALQFCGLALGAGVLVSVFSPGFGSDLLLAIAVCLS
jgi:hypothetical protein